MYERIFIFGATGSGKTTLANYLSKKFDLLHYTTDKLIYTGETWDKKYPEKVRDAKVKKISKEKKWVVEGVHRGEWIYPMFKKCNFVIILAIPRIKLIKRVLLREFKRFLNKVYPRKSIFDIPKLIKYAYIYKNDNFVAHKKLVCEYKKEYVILRSEEEIKEFLANLTKGKFI